jgi:LysM repeat protein
MTGDDRPEESFLTVVDTDTTTTSLAPPTTAVVVTAALTPVPVDAADDAYDIDDASASESQGNSDSASSGGSSDSGGDDASDPGSSGAGVLAAPAERSAAQCGNPYEVQAGDFWVAIAGAVDMSLDDLLRYNEATQDTPIFPGSIVCLPLGASMLPDTTVATTVAVATTEAPAPTPTTATPATTAAPAPESSTAVATTPPEATPAPTQPPANDGDDGDGGSPAPDGPVPSGGEVEQMIREIWPDDLEEQALRIAWRESNYRPDVTSPTGCCVGVFQIHWPAHQSWLDELGITSRSQLFDARANINAAYVLYQRSGGWGPWGQ